MIRTLSPVGAARAQLSGGYQPSVTVEVKRRNPDATWSHRVWCPLHQRSHRSWPSTHPRRVARSNSVNVLALCIGYSLGMLATWSVRSPVSARRASARKGIAVILAIVVVACGLLGRQTVVGWDANRLHLYLAPCLSIDVVTGALSEPELSRRYFWL